MEIPAPSTRPGLPHTGDSASGSVFDSNSPSRDYGGPRGIAISNGNVSKKVSAFANGGAYNNNNSNGYGNANGTYGNSNGSGSGNGTAAPAERRRRRSRKASMAQGEGASLAMSAAAVAVVEDDGAGRRESGGRVKGGGGGGASKTDASDDEEREALLALLSEAYGQVCVSCAMRGYVRGACCCVDAREAPSLGGEGKVEGCVFVCLCAGGSRPVREAFFFFFWGGGVRGDAYGASGRRGIARSARKAAFFGGGLGVTGEGVVFVAAAFSDHTVFWAKTAWN